jgi:hypothetical protein
MSKSYRISKKKRDLSYMNQYLPTRSCIHQSCKGLRFCDLEKNQGEKSKMSRRWNEKIDFDSYRGIINQRVKEEDFSDRKDVNDAKAHYCTDCGTKNWIFLQEDVELSKFKCDQCNAWNYIEPYLKKAVKIEEKIVEIVCKEDGCKNTAGFNETEVSFLTMKHNTKDFFKCKPCSKFFNEKRKEAIKKKFSRLWYKKDIYDDDDKMIGYVIMTVFMIAFIGFLTDAFITTDKRTIQDSLILSSIFLAIFLAILGLLQCEYGFHTIYDYFKGLFKLIGILVLFITIAGLIVLGIYKLLAGVVGV